MAGAVIVEGTWDELAERAEEFRGHKLRLEVLPEEGFHGGTGSLLDFLGDYVGAFEGTGANHSDDTGTKFAEDLAEKHRQGHL